MVIMSSQYVKVKKKGLLTLHNLANVNGAMIERLALFCNSTNQSSPWKWGGMGKVSLVA